MSNDSDTELLARRRARLGVWIVVALVAVLAAIAGNDALVGAGAADSPARIALLAVLAFAAVLLVTVLFRYANLTRRSWVEPELRRKLWDELASANQVRAMALAYLSLLGVAVVLAVISMFTTLSAPWVVNGMLVTALGVQAIAFAVLECRGDRSGA